MKLVKTEDAVGQVLCHDMTQIIVGVTKDARFRKGHVVTKEDIPVLLSMGKENLYVWEMDGSMLHEDDAAAILADAAENSSMTRSLPKEGKIELKSTIDGLFVVDRKRLDAINSIDGVMVATRPGYSVVHPGDKLAGMRVIPLVIKKDTMKQVECIADKKRPLLSVVPFSLHHAAVIVTGNEVKKGLIQDTFSQIVITKLQEYDIRSDSVSYSGDDSAVITNMILEAKNGGADIICCTGGMSVDPDDRTPLGIRQSGAHVVSYGTPVLPGAMLLVSYLGDTPVIGLPGCVMYAKRTVFDLILPRLAARVPVTKEDLVAFGDGGLCLGCEPCTYPQCGFGKGGI